MIDRIKATKYIALFVIFLIYSGILGTAIALCNHYLLPNQLLTTVTKGILAIILFTGYYLIYKWFSRKIDHIDNQGNDQ